ncbi:hypothetical protein ACFW08_05775 [Streptomyces sp. NPDC058960]|uniref:hypothetical protein n=1 Tax=Streptomyces sp. NPDC058960 TaxID=3346679 RepID=UPI0036B0C702
MSARETLTTTLTNLLARTRTGRMDAHRAEAERMVDEALKEHAQRSGEAFDELFRQSVQRAKEKRKARVFPYELEVGE